MSYSTLPGAPPEVAKTKTDFPLRLGKLLRNDFVFVGAWLAKHGAPTPTISALVVSVAVAFLRGIIRAVCPESLRVLYMVSATFFVLPVCEK